MTKKMAMGMSHPAGKLYNRVFSAWNTFENAPAHTHGSYWQQAESHARFVC